MTAGSHPSRSPEFLSRLHDGELSPAERAHFESHRAHCAECRAAAAEFEAALALYRSSHPSPASPDLAARILRKLQSRPARRPSFGATFGIDLRWAGAFAAAVIATIVGSAIVARNEATERRLSRDEAIRVSVIPERKPPAAEPAAPSVAEPAAPAAPEPVREAAARAPRLESRRATVGGAGVARQREEAQGRIAAAPPEVKKDKERRDELAAEPLREKPMAARSEKDAGAAPPRLAMKNAAPPPPAAAAQAPADAIAPKSAMRASERAGGEGTATGFADAPRPVRLVVVQADGAGSPPELVAARDVDVPAALRGRSFILVVDAAGRVRQAAPERPAPAQEAAADGRKEELLSLLSLRFAPGDRQRRLLLRIE